MAVRGGFVITYHDGERLVVMTDGAFTENQRAAVRHVIENAGKVPLDVPIAEQHRIAGAHSPILLPSEEAQPGGFIEQQEKLRRGDESKKARLSGYTGDMCSNCGSSKMRRNGSCLLCEGCGQTTGCS